MWPLFEDRSCTIAIIYALSFIVWITPSLSGVCVFSIIPLRFSLCTFLCFEFIIIFVWLCIAFFWFNKCCYQKPLYGKTENWSSLEWSKAVHLFRVWLTQTLNNGYTCKSFIKLTPELQTQSVLKSVAQSVSQSLGKLFSYT